MRGNFSKCHAIMRKWEGGDVNHKDDPGGLTSRGVTAKRGAEYRRKKGLAPKAVTAWSEQEVEDFYRSEFWQPVRGDDLPAGVDLSVFDFGVNSGTSRSAKKLQAIVGAKADGQIGLMETIPAVKVFIKKYGVAELIKRHCAARLSFVQSLNIWKVFGKGWGRRIAGIRASALAMVLTSEQLVAEATKSEQQAKNNTTIGAAGSGTVVVGGGTTEVVTNVDWMMIASIGVGVLVLLAFTAFAVTKAQQTTALLQEASRKVA